jgi:hypothetical protein
VLILLPLIVLLALALVIAGLVFGTGPLARGGRPREMSLLALGAPALTVSAVVIFGVVGLGVIGGLRSDTDPGGQGSPPAVVATTLPPTSATGADAPATATAARLGPVVHMPRESAVGELETGTVLQLKVRGLNPFASARVRQCVGGERVRCANSLSVQFAEDGSAAFQYLVIDDFDGAGRCRASDPPCFVEVAAFGEDPGVGVVRLDTVFEDPVPPPGRISVTPSTGLAEQDDVRVELRGFPPGAPLHVLVCGGENDDGVERCGVTNNGSTVRADGTGRAETTLTISSAPAAASGVVCDRSHRCHLKVGSDSVVAASNVVELTFAAPPGVDYEPARLTVALLVAGGLLLLCLWLIRATDWSPIGEAAAPEIDETDYADLDALVAAMPPEEDVFA